MKKEAPAQVSSCEICDIFNNIYFVEHLLMAASENASPKLKPSEACRHSEVEYQRFYWKGMLWKTIYPKIYVSLEAIFSYVFFPNFKNSYLKPLKISIFIDRRPLL